VVGGSWTPQPGAWEPGKESTREQTSHRNASPSSELPARWPRQQHPLCPTTPCSLAQAAGPPLALPPPAPWPRQQDPPLPYHPLLPGPGSRTPLRPTTPAPWPRQQHTPLPYHPCSLAQAAAHPLPYHPLLPGPGSSTPLPAPPPAPLPRQQDPPCPTTPCSLAQAVRPRAMDPEASREERQPLAYCAVGSPGAGRALLPGAHTGHGPRRLAQGLGAPSSGCFVCVFLLLSALALLCYGHLACPYEGSLLLHLRGRGACPLSPCKARTLPPFQWPQDEPEQEAPTVQPAHQQRPGDPLSASGTGVRGRGRFTGHSSP